MAPSLDWWLIRAALTLRFPHILFACFFFGFSFWLHLIYSFKMVSPMVLSCFSVSVFVWLLAEHSSNHQFPRLTLMKTAAACWFWIHFIDYQFQMYVILVYCQTLSLQFDVSMYVYSICMCVCLILVAFSIFTIFASLSFYLFLLHFCLFVASATHPNSFTSLHAYYQRSHFCRSLCNMWLWPWFKPCNVLCRWIRRKMRSWVSWFSSTCTNIFHHCWWPRPHNFSTTFSINFGNWRSPWPMCSLMRYALPFGLGPTHPITSGCVV